MNQYLHMSYPRIPRRRHPTFVLRKPNLVVDIEDEVYKSVRVVHPTHQKDDVGMVVGDPESLSLYNGRDEDGKRQDKVSGRLSFGEIEFVLGDLSVEEG